MFNSKAKGFTLIECIISIFLLSILSLVFLSLYGTAIKIYRESAVLHQKFDQQINIAASEVTYDDSVPSSDRLAYAALDMDFEIKYSNINSSIENNSCKIKSTVYEVGVDRFGQKPSDIKYDNENSDLGNYSYYHTDFIPYTPNKTD